MSEPTQDPVDGGHGFMPSPVPSPVPSPSSSDPADEITNDVDRELLARARGLGELPPTERADALDQLNRDVVAELRAIEDL